MEARRPPDKVQCMRSGEIFPRERLAELQPGRVYTSNVCPVCGFSRGDGVYTPCTVFQNVDVDVT